MYAMFVFYFESLCISWSENLAMDGIFAEEWSSEIVLLSHASGMRFFDDFSHSFFLVYLLFPWFFHYLIISQRKYFSKNLMQFISEISHALILRFGIKNMCIGNLTLKKSEKMINHKWNKSVFWKMIYISKTGCKNLRILEISCENPVTRESVLIKHGFRWFLRNICIFKE